MFLNYFGSVLLMPTFGFYLRLELTVTLPSILNLPAELVLPFLRICLHALFLINITE